MLICREDRDKHINEDDFGKNSGISLTDKSCQQFRTEVFFGTKAGTNCGSLTVEVL
jgi:hypothetical protein